MVDQQWTWQHMYLIPSRSGAGREVQQEILYELKRQRWVPRDIFAIHLAMEEALANAIKHGNRYNANKSVRVRCLMSPELVRIEVADEGVGFNVSQVPNPTDPDRIEAPSGRGIMLMRSFMSRVEFNALGNQVTMEKERSEAGEPLLGEGAVQEN